MKVTIYRRGKRNAKSEYQVLDQFAPKSPEAKHALKLQRKQAEAAQGCCGERAEVVSA